MSIQPNNVQGSQNLTQVNASATQETNQVQNPVPAQLGESHSIGKTLSRCFASIQTAFANLGTYISNLFSSKAEVAPARPNLPQNFDNMTFGEKCAYNAALGEKITNRDPSIMPQIEKAINEASYTFSDFGTIDKNAVLESIADKLSSSSDVMNDANLLALAKTTTGEHFVTNIATNLINEHPEAHKISAVVKNGFATNFALDKLLSSLSKETDAQVVADSLPKLKEKFFCKIQSTIDTEEVKTELFEAGQSMFTKQTGLGADVKVNTHFINNKVNLMEGNIHAPFATTEKPYLRADRETLKAGLQGKVEEFYKDKATAYNSISTLNLPESISKDWQDFCVTTRDKINSNLFVQVNNIATEVLKSDAIGVFTSSTSTVDEKIQALKELGSLVHQKIEDIVGKANLQKMGLDEQSLVESLVLQVVLHPEKSNIIAYVKSEPDSFKALKEQLLNSHDVLLQSRDADSNPDYLPIANAVSLVIRISEASK